MPMAHTETGMEIGEMRVVLDRLSLRYPGAMQVKMLERHQVSCEGGGCRDNFGCSGV